MKNDITNKSDIKLLVDTFYDKVKANSTIGNIFNDIAKVDWQYHLPKMYSFWASLLLDEHSFSGNPMLKHIELSKLTPMTEIQFSEWLLLFTQTTDELFEGKKADEAKTRAANIARLMLHKIQTVSAK
ncbi:MAG: group III truncated hemoglobin [Bacteroidetes bacterium]|jgi:hemoglobin|nr:group III truncated hemoglobin [Bacteroidota bacterium]MBL0080906.1 group III truncated hemoglobin [Bacteroidota bacterium]